PSTRLGRADRGVAAGSSSVNHSIAASAESASRRRARDDRDEAEISIRGGSWGVISVRDWHEDLMDPANRMMRGGWVDGAAPLGPARYRGPARIPQPVAPAAKGGSGKGEGGGTDAAPAGSADSSTPANGLPVSTLIVASAL